MSFFMLKIAKSFFCISQNFVLFFVYQYSLFNMHKNKWIWLDYYRALHKRRNEFSTNGGKLFLRISAWKRTFWPVPEGKFFPPYRHPPSFLFVSLVPLTPGNHLTCWELTFNIFRSPFTFSVFENFLFPQIILMAFNCMITNSQWSIHVRVFSWNNNFPNLSHIKAPFRQFYPAPMFPIEKSAEHLLLLICMRGNDQTYKYRPVKSPNFV